MAYPPAPAAKTPLGRYRVLSPNAGLHVSPLCLGGASIGDCSWTSFMGSMDKESSFKLLDAYSENGGNFIDTANNYQNETSEKIIGEWMKERGNRDQMVIATKVRIILLLLVVILIFHWHQYTNCYKNYLAGEDSGVEKRPLYTGNNNKSLHLSVNASLEKLQTDYIDILYVHWWDYATSVKEVMDSLHTLVQLRKVLYLGISDSPAWIVSQANEYAKAHGKTPFSIYQGAWSVLQRDLEREILPMARAHGMAIAPFNVLAAGRLRSSKEEKAREESGEGGRTAFKDWRKSENETKMTEVLEKIAAELGEDIESPQVALAYVMHKTPYVFPIIGGRKVEHLNGNIKALELKLSDEQMKLIESTLPFDVGFPSNFVGNGTEYGFLFKAAFDVAPLPRTLPVGH
ncbi:aryl-alcohol dehydrogenase AAD14 [Flagelloscypha sp. PMI_526]|nr:aryl-alcohol dehydrogenase AAD14 [Flagelloscypha sp. PMI_526]